MTKKQIFRERVIWKYELEPGQNQIEISKDFKILHIGIDGNKVPCVWVQVDPEKEREPWPYNTIPTGEKFDAGIWSKHYGTFVMVGGLVFHVRGF